MTPKNLLLSLFVLLHSAYIYGQKDCTKTSIGQVPLPDLGTGTYQGDQSGLYPGGSNFLPIAHDVTINPKLVPVDGAQSGKSAGQFAERASR